MNIILAILLGTLFGLILQRIGAADPDKILGMLRLTDLHLARTILLGIGLSSILLFAGLTLGLVDPAHLSPKPLVPGVVLGGLIFGIGWAVSAYCPGTGLAALGSGRWDALAFVAGGLAGAGVYMSFFGRFHDTMLFEEMVGGTRSLVSLGRHPGFLGGWIGPLLAVAIGLSLVILAFRIPERGRWG